MTATQTQKKLTYLAAAEAALAAAAEEVARVEKDGRSPTCSSASPPRNNAKHARPQ